MRVLEQGSDAYKELASLVKELLVPIAFDDLRDLIREGPLEAGSGVSNSGRDMLVHLGLAKAIVVRGRQGFYAATSLGWDVYHAVL